MRFDTNFCLEELFGESGPPSIERTERALIVIVKSVKKRRIDGRIAVLSYH
jgi:hypothetical protein